MNGLIIFFSAVYVTMIHNFAVMSHVEQIMSVSVCLPFESTGR